MTNLNPGAQHESVATAPVLDLAKLTTHLATALDTTTKPLLEYDPEHTCVVINPSRILQVLPNMADVFNYIKPNKRSGKTIRIGGRIKQGTDKPLHDALLHINNHITTEFAALCTTAHISPSDLVISSGEGVKDALQSMGNKVKGYMDRTQDTAITCLQDTTFIDPATPNLPISGRVGRVMSAIEAIEGRERLDLFLEALERLILHDNPDSPTDEIKHSISDLRKHYNQGDKQLQDFIKFLDDDGSSQARIRLVVASDIMDAIRRILLKDKSQNAQLAAEYIRRILAFVTVEDAELDLEQHYDIGVGAKFLLSDEVAKNAFYACLPVWCHWNNTIFEAMTTKTDGSQVLRRQIGYRFKVNGNDPELKKSAFEARLQRISEALLPEASATTNNKITKHLVQLLGLAIVIPRSVEEMDVDIEANIHKGVNYLNRLGKRAVSNLLQDLSQPPRIAVMKNITSAITKVLKQKEHIIDELACRPRIYYLNVLRTILNKERAMQGMRDPLIAPADGQNQQTVFFSCIRVSTDQPLPGALFSLQTTVTLKESLLYATPNVITCGLAQRVMPERLVQIMWYPATPVGAQQAAPWRFNTGLVVKYSPNFLGHVDTNNQLTPERSTRLAILRIAFTVLTYVALKVLCERLAQPAINSARTPLTALMLRLQDQGRESSDQPLSASQGIYTIAQAIEHALGQHLRTRMQGFVPVDSADPHKQFKQKNIFNAFMTAFPLWLQTRQLPTIDNIGVLTFISRPVTDHPTLVTDADKDFVLIGRTYQALIKKELPGYKLVAGVNLLALESGQEVFANSTSIFSAVERLYNNGCKHIIYMGQRHAGRQLGRGSIRHRHHEQPEFLAHIQRRFLDLQLYPMVHDVFPATRLRIRGDAQDAFEITDYQSHLKVWDMNWDKLNARDLVPIYSLATLQVVGDSNSYDLRPQSGFATYFLLTDTNPELLEQETRKRLDLIDEHSPIHHDIIAVLRGIHYLESEAPAVKRKNTSDTNKYIRPVLHPYPTLQTANIAGAGEIVLHPSSKHADDVILNLPAMLARVTNVLNAFT